MKYFEFNEPYYALIQAENQTSAVVTYSNEVCILDDYDYRDAVNSLVVIDKESAWEKYKKAQTEDGEFIPLTELRKDFQSNTAKVLLVSSDSL